MRTSPYLFHGTFLFLCVVLSLDGVAQVDAFIKGGSLSQRWELDDSTRNGTFLIRPYKPVFFLPASWTSNSNTQPTSGVDTTSLPVAVPYQATEFKFQLSLKFKVAQGLFKGHGDLWFAHTQSMRWQLYNPELSRLFRETNYEPELILNFATNVKLLGFRMCMAGVGFIHQSNGRAFYLTRSWNRVVAHLGFERPGWAIVVRPWMRVQEKASVDENPNIERYMGRGDLLVVHQRKGHVISMLGRHSLDLSPGRGSVQFDWAIPMNKRAKFHLQVFHGYGESMIDFNHQQTVIGGGISLVEWL
jgi:phospholipase A1